MGKEDLKITKLSDNYWLIDIKGNPNRPDLTEQYQLYKNNASSDKYTLTIVDNPVADIQLSHGLLTVRLNSNDEIIYSAKVGNPGTVTFRTNSEKDKYLKKAVKKVAESQWWTK